MVKIVEAGQQIGIVDCPGCGVELPLKVGQNGSVFFYCQNIVGERGGKKEKCYTRNTFGRTASERIKSDYLEQEAIDAKIETRKTEASTGTAADDAKPGGDAGRKPERRGGVIGAIGHFLAN
jgi:ssDNA-binding Zn-finger/Zn-ribbon topoisomerase 1